MHWSLYICSINAEVNASLWMHSQIPLTHRNLIKKTGLKVYRFDKHFSFVCENENIRNNHSVDLFDQINSENYLKIWKCPLKSKQRNVSEKFNCYWINRNIDNGFQHDRKLFYFKMISVQREKNNLFINRIRISSFPFVKFFKYYIFQTTNRSLYITYKYV